MMVYLSYLASILCTYAYIPLCLTIIVPVPLLLVIVINIYNVGIKPISILYVFSGKLNNRWNGLTNRQLNISWYYFLVEQRTWWYAKAGRIS